jgi:hypothetical protein
MGDTIAAYSGIGTGVVVRNVGLSWRRVYFPERAKAVRLLAPGFKLAGWALILPDITDVSVKRRVLAENAKCALLSLDVQRPKVFLR